MGLVDKLNFSEKGLIACIIQDDKTNRVLTLCYMNKEAIQKSFEEGKVYVFRRSKEKLMLKGKTSGCIQIIKSVYVDCEFNSLLFKVEQIKAACHMGYFACYFRQVDKEGNEKIVEKRIFNPQDVYKDKTII
ncbi:MAG: phosphoribosyl-AMP cyclohydrolase [Candidatus Omnitrophica bacterium]|nr:phosphoribosyl-AMP cyclohydrolase [Candidatus Omnitrophota bacterium]